MTVTEARRFRRRGNLLERREPQFGEFKEKLCVEIITPDEKAQQIVETLVSAARTRSSGEGKVVVLPVDSDVRVQTGETDDGRADATLTLRIFNDFRVFQLASNR